MAGISLPTDLFRRQKGRFSQDTQAEYAGYRIDGIALVSNRRHRPFLLSPGQSRATRPLMQCKSLNISASVPRSVKKSPSLPMSISPATEPKPGSPTHDFLLPARDLVWAPVQESLGSELGPFIFSFSAGVWSPSPLLKRWPDFSTHCHQYDSTQQKSVIQQFLDRIT